MVRCILIGVEAPPTMPEAGDREETRTEVGSIRMRARGSILWLAEANGCKSIVKSNKPKNLTGLN